MKRCRFYVNMNECEYEWVISVNMNEWFQSHVSITFKLLKEFYFIQKEEAMAWALLFLILSSEPSSFILQEQKKNFSYTSHDRIKVLQKVVFFYSHSCSSPGVLRRRFLLLFVGNKPHSHRPQLGCKPNIVEMEIGTENVSS